ncbi:small acidic protein 1 [Medicago truncatula]|uniref:small acidic protein 1 n=1 Tax=Medicago truncatula TaxID=3880 RepID=UPI000D2F18DC|nr:small acidic protein 1 [Medicago truncatula]
MNDLKYQFDLRRREKDNRRMRTMDLFGEEMEDQITTMAMDVDDVDNFDILSEGISVNESKVADADFFNSFQDDFDDADIN